MVGVADLNEESLFRAIQMMSSLATPIEEIIRPREFDDFLLPDWASPKNEDHKRRWSPEFANLRACDCLYCHQKWLYSVHRFPDKSPETKKKRKQILTKNGRMPWKVRRKG